MRGAMRKNKFYRISKTQNILPFKSQRTLLCPGKGHCRNYKIYSSEMILKAHIHPVHILLVKVKRTELDLNERQRMMRYADRMPLACRPFCRNTVVTNVFRGIHGTSV